MGRALKKAKVSIGEQAEKEKREARQKEMQYQNALEAADRLAQARKDWAQQLADAEAKQQALKSETSDLKAQVKQFMQAAKEARTALDAEKRKYQDEERARREIQQKVERLEKANNGKLATLESDLKAAQDTLREKEQRLASLSSDKDSLVSRSHTDSEIAEKNLREAEHKVEILTNSLAAAKTEGVELQAKLAQFRTDSAAERAASDARVHQLQIDLETERDNFRASTERNQRNLHEKNSRFRDLDSKHNLLEQQTSVKLDRMQQELQDALATLHTEEEAAQAAASASNAKLTEIRTECAGLNARLQAANSGRSEDVRASAAQMQADRAEAEEKSNKLCSAIADAEKLLASTQSELAIANGKIENLGAQLDQEEANLAEAQQKNETETEALEIALAKAREELKVVSEQTDADNTQIQNQVITLRRELTEAGAEYHRIASEYESKIFELEQSISQKEADINDLTSNAEHAVTMCSNQLSNLETQIEEEQQNFDARLDMARQQAQEAADKLAGLRTEYDAEKLRWDTKEARYQSEIDDLVSQVGILSNDLQAAKVNLANEIDNQNKTKVSSDAKIQEVQRAQLNEKQSFESKIQDVLRENTRAEELYKQEKAKAQSNTQDFEALKMALEERITQAEVEAKQAEDRAQQLEHIAADDVQQATARLQEQLDLYTSMVEALRADKNSLMEIIGTLRQQVRENGASAGRIHQEIAALDKTMAEANEQYTAEVDHLRDIHDQEMAKLQADRSEMERRIMSARQQSEESETETKELVKELDRVQARLMEIELQTNQLESQTVGLQDEDRQMLGSILRLQEQLSAAQSQAMELKSESEQELAAARAAAQEAAAQGDKYKAEIANVQKLSESRNAATKTAVETIQTEAAAALATKIQAVEKRIELEIKALSQENRAMQVELQFLGLQSEVAQSTQKELSDMRKTFERQLHALRTEYNDATTELQELEETHTAFVQNAELTLQEKKANFTYQLKQQRRELTQPERRLSAISLQSATDIPPYRPDNVSRNSNPSPSHRSQPRPQFGITVTPDKETPQVPRRARADSAFGQGLNISSGFSTGFGRKFSQQPPSQQATSQRRSSFTAHSIGVPQYQTGTGISRSRRSFTDAPALQSRVGTDPSRRRSMITL